MKDKEEIKTDASPLRRDTEEGLKFVHRMSMQMKSDLYDTVSRLQALVQHLQTQGLLNEDVLDSLHEETRESEYMRVRDHALVKISDATDKYSIESASDIDCEARLPICHARCCLYDVKLSVQDLEEGVLKWDYGKPYVLPHDGDGYCIYSCRGTGAGCSQYAHRPAVCRQYDCRTDPNIWIDFDNCIAVPLDSDAQATQTVKENDNETA